MRTTTSPSSTPARSARRVGAIIAIAVALVACGSDSDGTVDVPEEGTGSAYNDAIIASESHDEILLNGGDGEIVVAVDCDPETGGTIVTVVAEGLEPAVYTGVFDPSTGVDLTLDATAGGQSISEAEMTLDAEEYTVTFADIDGGVFNLRGCTN
ncbi:MAG: hypothetical protein WBL31_10020 [Ilumatobacteraceae bacterium]|jgi:hypothetical protein